LAGVAAGRAGGRDTDEVGGVERVGVVPRPALGRAGVEPAGRPGAEPLGRVEQDVRAAGDRAGVLDDEVELALAAVVLDVPGASDLEVAGVRGARADGRETDLVRGREAGVVPVPVLGAAGGDR